MLTFLTLSSLSFKFYATAHRILQPTPLVLALRSQLISQVAKKDQLHPQALDDNHQQNSAEKGRANEDEVSPNVKIDKHGWNLPLARLATTTNWLSLVTVQQLD